MSFFGDWLKRNFGDRQVMILAVLLVIGFSAVLVVGDMLVPVLAAVVIAYLLDGPTCMLRRLIKSRSISVWLVFSAFMAVLLIILFGLLPILSRQVTQLISWIPGIVGKGQELLLQLPSSYPAVFTEQQVLELIDNLRYELTSMGQEFLSLSLTSVVNIFTIAIYLVLMPMLVFFFLKDKGRIVDWVKSYLPRDRQLAAQVWGEVDIQIANYVRGKFWEVLIVWAATYVTFIVMDLNFAMLLAALVGLSVVVPYVGATVVTVPVTLVAYFQFGWGPDFAWLMIAYGVVQALDGNLLVPLLFSEVVDLHPIAIIVAILFFGGLWGFWGVFFAIPLATLVQAVLRAWPRIDDAVESVE